LRLGDGDPAKAERQKRVPQPQDEIEPAISPWQRDRQTNANYPRPKLGEGVRGLSAPSAVDLVVLE
jgi:hypothetical protein